MEPKESKYGLFKFSKNIAKLNSKLVEKRSVFDDSDSDSESAPPEYYQSSNLKRQAQDKIQKAIEINSSIFQYDEIYDEIKSKQTEKTISNVNNKPKYISNLLKAAEARKREQEIRLEKKIQKEREREGDEFKDKESFVTSSYRSKLEEMRKTHEELEKQSAIDNMLDVTKQHDLNGFYRSLYKNSMFTDNNEISNEKEKIVFNKSNVRNKISIREREIPTDNNENENEIYMEKSDVTSQPENDKVLKKSMEKGLEFKSETKKKESDKSYGNKKPETAEQQIRNDQIQGNQSNKESKATKEEEKSLMDDEQKEVRPKVTLSRAQLIEKLFTKRTVGSVFEEARKRYLERKLLRTAS